MMGKRTLNMRFSASMDLSCFKVVSFEGNSMVDIAW